MRIDDFEGSLNGEAPPDDLGLALKALWHAAKGNWHEAHRLAQDEKSAAGSWVHAYLHRVEGDESNAGYWYRRAGKTHAQEPLPEEWRSIAAALLDTG